MAVLTLNLANLELESTLRPTGLNGAPTSVDYNDSAIEVLSDLATLTSSLNNTVLPILTSLSSNALPSNANSVALGIQGSTVYSDTNDLTSLFYDQVNSVALTVSQSLRILYGTIANIQATQNDIGIRVSTLSTSLSTTGQSNASSAVSGLYQLSASFQTQLTSTQAAAANSTSAIKNIQSQLVTTGTVTPPNTNSVTITWASPFPDSTYTISYALNDDSGFLRIQGFSYTTAANGTGIGIIVHVSNSDAYLPHTGAVSVTARQAG